MPRAPDPDPDRRDVRADDASCLSLHHFSFSSPSYLLVLLVVPLLFVFARVRSGAGGSRYAVAFTNLDLARPASSRRRRTPWWRRLAADPARARARGRRAAALARPHIELTTARPQRDGRPARRRLGLDARPRRRSPDRGSTRPSTAMHDFLDRLPANDKVGLVTFSDKVQVLAAPTTDHAAVDSGLDVLRPAGRDGARRRASRRRSSSSCRASPRTASITAPAKYRAGSDRARVRRRAEPRHDHARSPPPSSRGRPASASTASRSARATATSREGTGFFAATIPVPPDPGVVALLARVSGGKAFDATHRARASTRSIATSARASASDRESTEITSWFELAAAVFLVGGVGAARARGGALP